MPAQTEHEVGRPVLVVMSGLPVAGKSSVASAIARALRLCLLELDHLEAPFLENGISGDDIGWAAYEALAALADDNLALGHGVVLDCVTWNNELRARWAALAAKHRSAWRPIEVVCSEPDVHRQRVGRRQRNIAGIPEVTWQRVEEARALYEDWTLPRLALDSVRPFDELVREALAYVQADEAAT